jgi:hypothetical protein
MKMRRRNLSPLKRCLSGRVPQRCAPRRPDVMAGAIPTRNHADFSPHPRNSSVSGCPSPSRIAPTTALPALPAATTSHLDGNKTH